MENLRYAFLCVLFLNACLTEAAEISLGTGRTFTTSQSSSDLSEASQVSWGDLAVQGEFLIDSGVENLRVGLDVGLVLVAS